MFMACTAQVGLGSWLFLLQTHRPTRDKDKPCASSCHQRSSAGEGMWLLPRLRPAAIQAVCKHSVGAKTDENPAGIRGAPGRAGHREGPLEGSWVFASKKARCLLDREFSRGRHSYLEHLTQAKYRFQTPHAPGDALSLHQHGACTSSRIPRVHRAAQGDEEACTGRAQPTPESDEEEGAVR
ncbi:uncharacterized protein LOC131998968 [Mustela nigripes]|uniref:uncharacterized protein LOC131998968 n=1 Tax=Mustela nigripes TaxID=77151 RepID=UPI002815540A|nr:uncharacterized protein LOC131998968 [Mustela nigripes]